MPDYRKLAKGFTQAIRAAEAEAAPAVNRIDMNYKDVTKRVPELTEAAKAIKSGDMTPEQYAELVKQVKPVTPYDFVPKPATAEEAINALTSNKKGQYGKTAEIGAGEQADLRLDIPAYSQHGVWVNSIHRKNSPTVYGSTSAVKNATMMPSPDKALNVATGETPKAPFAVIRGEWNPMDEAMAVKNAQKYLKHKDWRQVGYDPERHGYFYDRQTMAPILGAEEVIQIGPLVLAKKPKYGNPKDFPFSRGGLSVKRFGKGGKTGVALDIANAVQKASKEADAIIEARKLEEILKAKQAPMTTPQGTGLPLMPRSAGMYTPGVEQKDLARMPMVDKARAAGQSPKYTERMQDLLDSPTARKKVNTLIEKGNELGMREWYGTEPLRQVAMDIGMSQKQFDEFLAQMASASQRNPVDQQNRMGSYLWHLSQSGKLPDDAFLMTNKIKRGKAERPAGTAIELPPGYGSLAQGDIFSRGKQIASGDIEGALPETAKLGTFYRNLQGNLKPVTVDVNAVRGPIIERGDPRWLASKLVEKDEEGNILATHFPRRDVQSGKMSMKQAKERPGFWEAAPSGSEYAGFEDLWQRAAKRKGVAPAEAQALGWYGSADVTALKTKPELYIDNLERMIRRTAEQTGQNPRQVMEDVLRGKQYLKKKGGVVHKIKAFSDDETAKRYREEMLGEINKANGGAIKKLAWKQTPAMKMAQGGAPNLGPTTEHTMPDPGDAGQMRFERGYAEGGASSPEEMLTPPSDDQKGKARLMMEILARMAKDQGKEEIASLKKPRAVTDLLNKGVVASAAGIPADLGNLALTGVDFLREKATGKPVENRLASDKPFLGSEHLKDLMQQYGMVTDTERPMMETALSIASPAGALKGAVKGAEALPQAARAVEGGLNAATAAARRPFTPATVTMEAVAPDLAKFKPKQWQDTVTRRMTGLGAPVSMETMGGRQTTKRPAQGVYLNDPDEMGIRQLETNPMVAVDVPRAGSLETNKALRKDMAQAGTELGQESVAAHRFLPMMTNNIADASSMLIKPKGGKLSNEEVAALGKELPHMVVAHNPRLGGVVVYPFELKPGKVPSEFFDAQEVASRVLGKRAQFTYGKTDPKKDTTYIPKADYPTEGATAPSASSKAMRERLKRAEGRLFRQPAPAAVETP